MKKCTSCLQTFDLLKFELTYSSVSPNNRRNQCKKCRNEQRKKYECRHGDGLRERILKRNYNMTREQYHEMSKSQNHRCFICNEINKFGPWKDKLVVDHDHDTGKVRKLLCDKCNKGLGQFNDNPELLKKATEYLILHDKKITCS